MVRLFVPEGEGQHAITRRRPDPFPANAAIIDVPWRSASHAAGITALLALGGVSRPGMFLKFTAYLSAANITFATLDAYGRREVNRAVFKMDTIDPKPGKLWQRTKHNSVDEDVILGAAGGLIAVISRQAVPAVRGWKRVLGMVTVGAALGPWAHTTVGAALGLPRQFNLPTAVLDHVNEIDKLTRQTQYDRLHTNPEATKSLSRFGKLAFTYYSWPGLNLPFLGSEKPQPSTPMSHNPIAFAKSHGLTQEEIDQTTPVTIEFRHGELQGGPDVDGGDRVYDDSLANRDLTGLRDWLGRVQRSRKLKASQAQYVWQQLADKEYEFYNLGEDDETKDNARREAQFLSHTCFILQVQEAALSYLAADALKRLEQVETGGLSTQALTIPRDISEVPQGPHFLAEEIRGAWMRQKVMLAILERQAAMIKDIPVEEGSPQEAQKRKMAENVEAMRKNVKATEKLLNSYEETARKEDELAKP